MLPLRPGLEGQRTGFGGLKLLVGGFHVLRSDSFSFLSFIAVVRGGQGYTELAISCGVSTCGYIVACQSVSWEVQPRSVKRQMQTF